MNEAWDGPEVLGVGTILIVVFFWALAIRDAGIRELDSQVAPVCTRAHLQPEPGDDE